VSISRSGDRWLFEPDGAAVLITGTRSLRHIDFSASATATEAPLSTDLALKGFVVDHEALGIADLVIGSLLGGGDR
jgi:hypothetical protein